MSVNFKVRPVIRQDYDQWLTLWGGYNAFYGRQGDTALSPEVITMIWSRLFDVYGPVHALVAESGKKLLGLAHYIYYRNTISIEPSCYLQDLFTDETARCQGVAGALINGVYEQAKLAGASRVYWHTHQTNHTAMLLYDKMADRSGFVVYRKTI